MLAWLCPGQAGYWRAHLQASVRAWVHTCLHMPRTPRWKPSPDVVRSWQFYDDDQMIFQAALSGRLNCRRLLCYSLLRVVSFVRVGFPSPSRPLNTPVPAHTSIDVAARREQDRGAWHRRWAPQRVGCSVVQLAAPVGEPR